jgi:hypothetical protein
MNPTKSPSIYSPANHGKNCMYSSNNESEEVHRKIDIIRLKNCTGEYEKKFTRQ